MLLQVEDQLPPGGKGREERGRGREGKSQAKVNRPAIKEGAREKSRAAGGSADCNDSVA